MRIEVAMEIQSSRLSLTASHAYSETRVLQVRAERVAADTPRESAPVPRIAISATALAASRAGAASAFATASADIDTRALEAPREGAEGSLVPAEFALLEELVFQITGRRLRVFDASALNAGEAPSAVQGPPAPTSSNTNGERVDTRRFTATEAIAEAEATTFAAEGEIVTADGQRLRFQVSVAMSRSFASVRQFSSDAAGKPVDPLVINFDGSAAELRDARFQFDLDANGTSEAIATLAAGSAYLVFDRNGNGKADDGGELFGPTQGDGFAELAALDLDRNGWIDAKDPAFARLSVWTPDASGGGPLRTLDEAGVAAIGLAKVATPFGLRGTDNAALGQVRSTGLYIGADRSVGTVQQIDLIA